MNLLLRSLCFCLVSASVASAEEPTVLEVGRFSAAGAGTVVPDGWKPLTFNKIARHTVYSLVKDDGISVVKAVSESSASGLIREVTIDPRAYPILRWRWRVGNVLEKGDVRRKAGDDYPARLYVTFAYEPDRVSLGKKLKYLAGQALFGAIPIAALNYIWDGKSPVGTLVDNAFTDFAKMIVVESGSTKVGAWVEEEHNVYEDYRLAFGEDPPAINGIAIMTDTDNTQERAVAYYGDIVFLQAAKPAP